MKREKHVFNELTMFYVTMHKEEMTNDSLLPSAERSYRTADSAGEITRELTSLYTATGRWVGRR